MRLGYLLFRAYYRTARASGRSSRIWALHHGLRFACRSLIERRRIDRQRAACHNAAG